MRNQRTGYSLLELILALGLAVVIISAIATAIQVNVMTLTEQQKRIEQNQVARNVIAMISADLRAALQYKPVDVTGLQDLAVSQAMIAGIGSGSVDQETVNEGAEGGTGSNGGSGDGGNGDSTSGGDTGSGGSSSGGEFSDDEEMASEECVSCRPTMIGYENMLMVDVSRLPRIDEYNPLVASDTEPRLPSDLKGVSYFIGKPEGGQPSNDSIFEEEIAQSGGLYRRQIDRAVAAYAGEEDIVARVDPYAELVAPEVVAIGLRYFDGSDWVPTWDNVDQGGFPSAIEITVILDSEKLDSLDDNYSFDGFDPETMIQFRSVVHLPIAEVAEE